MTAINAVLFDLDDTLNNRDLCWEAFVPRFLAHYAGRISKYEESDIKQAIVRADRGGYRPKEELFGELVLCLPWSDPPTAQEMEGFWRKCFPDCMVERRGAGALLNDLRRREFKIGIISNGRSRTQKSKLARLGFASLVDVVLISEDAGMKKPDPQIFCMALEKLRCGAGDALFVGDHPVLDVAGPKIVGMSSAWLALGRDWPGGKPPDYTISELDELRDILKI